MTVADSRIVDVPERSRLEIHVDGEVAGYSDYRRRPDLIAFFHTVIDPRFEGRDLASLLVRAARRHGPTACRSCRSGHKEYLDQVPEELRARFDLPAHA